MYYFNTFLIYLVFLHLNKSTYVIFQSIFLVPLININKNIWIGMMNHLSLLASLSLSINSKTSPTLTGPFTFLIKCLFSASLPVIKVTFTWVIPPLEPVLPNNCVTRALIGYESIVYYKFLKKIFIKNNLFPQTISLVLYTNQTECSTTVFRLALRVDAVEVIHLTVQKEDCTFGTFFVEIFEPCIDLLVVFLPLLLLVSDTGEKNVRMADILLEILHCDLKDFFWRAIWHAFLKMYWI